MSEAYTFGRYELLGLLSVGGMAEVHLASITGPGGFRKFVVVKRILPDLQDDPRFAQMFMAEAQVTASLSHANIAQVFEFGEIDERLYLSMEFIHGIDLVKALRASVRAGVPVPRGLTLRVVRDLAMALHYAHTFADPFGGPRPVIHRDITPRNVMLTNSGAVKIIDFGIAKVAGAVTQTQAGNVKGSIGYLAPEQIAGEELDARCDVFSAGVILHELLTGRRLYAATEAVESMRLTITARAPDPATLVPGLPAGLSALTLKALERKRDNRFATARELATAIETEGGAELFDEEDVGAWVRQRFPGQLEKLQSLVNSVNHREDSAVRAMAGDLASHSESGSNPGAPRSRGLATAAAPAKEPATILVVDDSRTGQKVVALRLEAEGHRVVTCGSGEEALEMLAEMTPDLIVTDVKMGELDGFGLCAKVRERPELQTLPVIFLSASCLPEERSRGMAVGGDDFIRKPFDPADLVGRVRGHLNRVALLRPQKG